MASLQSLALRALLRVTVKRPLAKHSHTLDEAVRTARRVFQLGDARNRRVPRDARVVPVETPGVRGEWALTPGVAADRAILLVHGGGYVACSPLTYRAFAIALSRATQTPVFVVDYRLAPEHRFPAALDDVLAAYDALRERLSGKSIALVGDSAGGGLALAAALALRERQPDADVSLAAIVLYSPWTDLLATGASLARNARSDDMLAAAGMPLIASAYASLEERRTPLVSPLYASFARFPPTRVYASTSEALRDDAVRLADRARAQGAPFELVLEASMPHVWPLFDMLPEARRTLAETAAFLQCAWRRISAVPPGPVEARA